MTPYPSFTACTSCMSQPCNRLRYGGVKPLKYTVTRVLEFSMDERDCPFVIQHQHELHSLLSFLDTIELDNLVKDIAWIITPSHDLQFPRRHYIDGYYDNTGRIHYLETLWFNHAFVMLRVPPFYHIDHEMHQWLTALEHAPSPSQDDEPDDDPLDLDGMVAAVPVKKDFTITNPRWTHKDNNRNQASPDTARPGDVIVLSVDTTGVSDRTFVSFNLFNPAESKTRPFKTIRGTVKDNRASAEWTVTDPREGGDSGDAGEGGTEAETAENEGDRFEPAFDGELKSKSSGRGSVVVECENEFIGASL